MKMNKESYKRVWISIILFTVLFFIALAGIVAGGMYTGVRLFQVSDKIRSFEAQERYLREQHFYLSGKFCEVNNESNSVNGMISYVSESGNFSLRFPDTFMVLKSLDVVEGATYANEAGVSESTGRFYIQNDGENYHFVPRDRFLVEDDCKDYIPSGLKHPGHVVSVRYFKDVAKEYSAYRFYNSAEYFKIGDINGGELYSLRLGVADFDTKKYFFEKDGDTFLFEFSLNDLDESVVLSLIESIELK